MLRSKCWWVIYDLTTIRVEGRSEQSGEVRKFGMSKEGMVARQFLLGDRKSVV